MLDHYAWAGSGVPLQPGLRTLSDDVRDENLAARFDLYNYVSEDIKRLLRTAYEAGRSDGFQEARA